MTCLRLARTATLAVLAAVLVNGCGGSSVVNTGSTTNASTLHGQLALLEKEAQRVQAAHDIRRLQRAYGYYLDQGLWDEVADLFTRDASIEIALDGVYVGQPRIREYLYKLGAGRRGLKPGELHEHLQLQSVINVAPDGLTAKGRWRTVMMLGQQGQSAAWGEGPYEVEYSNDNGTWRISKLHWYQTFVVPYEGGWAKNKDLTGGKYVSKDFPPDRPSTETYGVWPAVYIPPFHYKNPVAPRMPAMTVDPSLAQLQRRIQALHDRDEIENLVSMYGYYLDKQQWDLLTDLFTEDGHLEISQRGVYVGHASIRRALELFGPQNVEPEHLHNHIQLQPHITLAADGQSARVRSRALSQLGVFNRIGVLGDGVYENEMVKVNGVWKIHKDHVYTTFFSFYDEGWAFKSNPAPKQSPKIPPDRPPTEIYESYPEVYTPAFHFKNPVTGGENTAPPPLPGTPLEKIVTRLEDESAIENLQRAYGFYVDKGLWQDAADLFANDNAKILESLKAQSPEGLVRGKLMNQLQLQPIVHVSPDGKTAKARWRFLDEVGEWQKSQLWRAGISENEYVKESGVWKIKSLNPTVRFSTPYTDGWAKTELNATVAPFHYKHPVTRK